MAEVQEPKMALETVGDVMQSIVQTLHSQLGTDNIVLRFIVCALVAQGHVLLEDVPGVGKTTLANALARVIDADVKRIQFTSDMMPSDVTGVGVWQEDVRSFVFHPGPLFSHVVIADEINRANPKAQAAMLEAMAEGSVSVDGITHPLPDPFLVLATQNPIELEGTFPLPEAQLDRFMIRVSIGYPSRSQQSAMLMADYAGKPLRTLCAVCNLAQIRELRHTVDALKVNQAVADYIVDLIEATRVAEDVQFGASPRAAFHMLNMAKAWALLEGRNVVLPQDVRSVASAVLAHRLVIRGSRELRAGEIIKHILETVEMPKARDMRV